MKKIFYAVTLVGFVAFLPAMAGAKTVRLNDCSGTQLSFKSAKAACKSGNHPGQTIVKCNNKGKIKDTRRCSTDGQKKGVYEDSCTGTPTGFKDLLKACKSGGHFGKLLVKCKNGEEKKRMQCESSGMSFKKTVIFKDKCGGDPVSGKDLKKACKTNIGETLVKCARKDNIWKEKKSMLCHGKKDRFKFKLCSPTERQTLIGDYQWAEGRVDTVLTDLDNWFASNPTVDNKLRKKMEKVQKKLRKIQTAMDRPRTYVCRANKNRCRKANAHTMWTGHNVKICDRYFFKSGQPERGSILVHEISHHKVETNDKGTEHGGCSSPSLASANSNFHKQAEYYEHLIECGLYIPN